MTEDRKIELMKKTISLAEKSVSEDGKISPKVGALLTNSNGEVLLDCYRGETGTGHHCEYGLLQKAKKEEIDLKDTILFVTLEPCTSRGKGKIPCSQRIVSAGIGEVYIGTLDPNPVITGKGELYLRAKGIVVNRYPNDLINELNAINKDFFKLYESSFLPNDSLFMKKRISQIMVEYINKQGYTLEELPSNWDIIFDYILAYSHNIVADPKVLKELMNKALGYAYDQKYALRDYTGDVRGEYNVWITTFKDILKELNITSLKCLSTLVVGIGNGLEGKHLYADIDNLTIVDIAPRSLAKAEEILNPSRAFVLNAQDLNKIDSDSIEAYVSLMTYQSTYFNIEKALLEAYRVLKVDGIIIVSIACGFMKDEHVYIDGLINPQTGLLDRNRPYDLIDIIRRRLITYQFTSLGIRTTPSEIFIYARKKHKIDEDPRQ